MRLEDHGDLFEGSVAGPFTDAVDRDLTLARSVHQSGHCVGRGHAQVVVAVGGDDGVLDSGDMVAEILDLGSIFLRKTVSGRIRDVHHGSSGLDHGFDYSGEEFIVGTSGILGVEFHIFNIFLGVFHRAYRPFENLLPGGVEFVPDMRV